MGKIVLIDPVQDPRWDRFVESHPFGWICHLSGWKQMLETTFSHMKGYYFALLDDSGQRIEAGLPVFIVRSRLLGDRLVSIPFATLCDPLVANVSQFLQLASAVRDLGATLKPRRIEIRSLYTGAMIRGQWLEESNFFKLHFLELKDGHEELLKRFHPKSVRHSIRRAVKNKLQLAVGETGSVLDRFFSLHMGTRKRLGLPLHPYRFFESLWKVFAPSGQVSILVAEKHNITLGALLLLKYKDRVSIDYSAYDETFADVRPNHFLFWEAIQMACREGFKIIDFGRTNPQHRNLMEFKSRWGTRMMDLPQFFYPTGCENSTFKETGSFKHLLLHAACRHAPVFAQKAIGEFCYRHLG
jgi:CelD/BcsL family acetyltransferase involved in cellulose biosynthesis